MKLVFAAARVCPPDPPNPRENPPDDLAEEAASCVSLCHLLTISFATGRRWYEDTSAAEDTDGVLSTMAVLMFLSMACTVDACRQILVLYQIPLFDVPSTYINDSAKCTNGIGPVNHITSYSGILHDTASDHNHILGRIRQLLDNKIDHLS